MTAPLKIAVIAGEASGDLLGGDLIAALREHVAEPIALVGVGGPALVAQGLAPLFDYSRLSIMGFTAVLARLPEMVRLIGQTASAIIDAKPDLLLIIDSPDFTHRVARRVRAALPDLPIIDYVSPSVWAWKSYRAKAMRSYVDHVLAILPFEPQAMAELDGPPCTYVGHRLRSLGELLTARQAVSARREAGDAGPRTILLLPGSRSTEIRRLLPDFLKTAELLAARGNYRFVLPTVPHQEALVRAGISGAAFKPDIVVGEKAKWRAFSEADAALAASGTVHLELALTGIPSVSCYRTDLIVRMIFARIRIWTGNLPNLVADYPVVPEYFDAMVRPALLCRWLEQLSADTPARRAMLSGFDLVFDRMTTAEPAGQMAAKIVAKFLEKRKPGHF